MKFLKSVLILFFTLFIGNTICFAQDKIVVKNSVDIDAKILEITTNEVKYKKFDNLNGPTYSILKSKVISIKYENGEIVIFPNEEFKEANVETKKVELSKIAFKNYKKFRFGIDGGFGFFLGKIGDEVFPGEKQYLKELKSGYFFGADATYYIKDKFGFGLVYSKFKTNNEIPVTVQNTSTGQIINTVLKDDITIDFFAPAFWIRLPSKNNKSFLNFNVAIGYLNYKNAASLVNEFQINGGTVGLKYGFGADFILSESTSIGVSLGYISGVLNQYRLNDGTRTTTIKLDKDNLQDVSRIDLGIGLRFLK